MDNIQNAAFQQKNHNTVIKLQPVTDHAKFSITQKSSWDWDIQDMDMEIALGELSHPKSNEVLNSKMFHFIEQNDAVHVLL